MQVNGVKMAIGKRSLMNEHMIAVLNKVSSMDPEPIQKSYLYYSQAEKETVDYMIAIGLLKETPFSDNNGNLKKGYVLGDFGTEIVDDIIRIQMKVDLRERIYNNRSDDESVKELIDIRREFDSAVAEGSEERASELRRRVFEKENALFEEYQVTVDNRIKELDERGNRKMATINKWKQQKKSQ